jgi:hypothetical protein
MNEKEIRSKRAAIRQEIKERMQRELEELKREIKERIAQERIPVEEKRKQYRREVHEEKLRLMELAKEEFRARKRMLGLSPDADLPEEPYDEPFEESPATPAPPFDDDLPHEEVPDFVEHSPGIRPEEAFIYEDKADSDVREYEAPIGEADALPFGVEPGPVEAGAPAGMRAEEVVEANNLFHYILYLIIHPVDTLDEFDDYLATPSGLVKVGIFYFASLLPVVLVVFLGETIAEYMPSGIVGTIIGSALSKQIGVTLVVLQTVINLLLYSFSIAIVNYFVTEEANFITLTVYFAFVEAVTRVIIYTLIIVAILGGVAAIALPGLMGLVGMGVALLFISFFFWRLALNIIVLMSAYGYDLFFAFVLAVGAFFVRRIIVGVVASQLGTPGF